MTDGYVNFSVTDRAIEAVQERLQKRNTPDARVRVGVKGFGCSGFKHIIEYDDNESNPKRDIELFFNGVRVVIDKKSAKILDGSTLDFVKTMKESGFEITSPNIDKTCGCGKSFSLKK